MRLKGINQKGFSPVLIVVAVAAVALIGGGAYYFFSKQNDNKDSTASTAQSKEAENACLEFIDDKDYCKFASSWSLDGSITTTITSPSEGSVMVIRSSGKDSHSTINNAGGAVSEVIILNGTTYMKNMSDGSWTKFSSESDTNTATPTEDYTPDFDFENEASKDTTTTKNLGKEACGELTCFKYQMLDSTAPDTETIVWFDDQDYKARRMTVKSAEGTSELSFSYEAVTITEPSPIVEAPNYESMTPEQLQQQLESLGQ